MRSVLAALALLTLTACDSSGTEDALVGTWTLTAASSEVQITSRTAQTVPNRTAAPTGSIAVTGATTAALGQVVNLFADPDGNINLAVESAAIGAAGYVQLVLSEFPTESQASIIDADAGLGYVAYFTPRRALVARDGGRFTVAPVTVSTGNETATASGTLRYPDLALTPGQPAVAERYEEPLDGTLRFVFEEDGTFRATAFSPSENQDVVGTWERVGDDVSVTVTEGSQAETVTFRTTLSGGTLEMTATNLGDFCAGECVQFYEGTVFATPGSLSAVDFVVQYRFRSGTAAAARTAPEGRRAAPPRPRPGLPILGRL